MGSCCANAYPTDVPCHDSVRSHHENTVMNTVHDALSTLDILASLSWTVRQSDRSRHVRIAVEFDGTVLITVPPRCRPSRAVDAVREHQYWIHKTVLKQEQRGTSIVSKQVVTGEIFPYLGHRYRLQLATPDGRENTDTRQGAGPVDGLPPLAIGASSRTAAAVVGWYRRQGQNWLDHTIPTLAARAHVKPGLRWRIGKYSRPLATMPSNWGYYNSADHQITIHWAALQMPYEWAQCLAAHEIAHAANPRDGHSKLWKAAFTELCPEWRNLDPKIKAAHGLQLWLGTTTEPPIEPDQPIVTP
jgi:predicted metal-dependent hydrolase